MTDNEKIKSFGDMVDATEKMAKPWQKTNFILTIALVLTNFFWAIVLFFFIWFAYMTPIDSEQVQELPSGTQTQHYSQGTTDGK